MEAGEKEQIKIFNYVFVWFTREMGSSVLDVSRSVWDYIMWQQSSR